MNRLDATRQVLLLEAAAEQLRERAKEVRLRLDADARAELDEHGAAPTWRLADLGTWSLPVSKEAATVVDQAALVAWCKQRHPTAIVEQIVPAFQKALLARLQPLGEVVVDPGTGEIVPGLGVRAGGVPQTLRFKANGDAEAVFDQFAADLVGKVTAAFDLGEPPSQPRSEED